MTSSIGVDVAVSLKYGKPIEYRGHMISYGIDSDGWRATCVLCGSNEGGPPDDLDGIHAPHLWFYVLGKFGECENSDKNIGKFVQDNANVNKYIGQPDTRYTRREMKEDILSDLPDHLQDALSISIS